MIANPEFARLNEEPPSLGEAMHNTLPIPMVEAVDVSKAIVYLVSDAGRYVTGVTMPVVAGALIY
jgi:hypothetical protein